jgi:hypothetical protein
MKTNKEKNQAHDAKMQKRVRPKGLSYDFKPLEAVIRSWMLKSYE